MPTLPELRTRRMRLRALKLEDAAWIQPQFERWEVVQYLNARVPWPYPPDGARQFLEMLLASSEEMAWAVELAGQPVGVISLHPGLRERGFWLTPEYWGQGLMAEASERVADFALRDLGWERLSIYNARENAASSAIKQRQGFRHVESSERDFVAGRLPSEHWELLRADWLATHPQPDPSWS